jgi:hypothetical protein
VSKNLLQYVFRIQELERQGYEYCELTSWWWNDDLKICVDDRTIQANYDNFINKVLNVQDVKGYSFYSYRKSNRDILETLYGRRFPSSKLLTNGGN